MTETTEQPGKKPRGRRTALVLGLVVIFIVIGLAYGAYWFLVARHRVVTDDAYVHGNRIVLMAQTQGTVSAISADDTDRVREGQELVMIDRADAESALEQAKAGLAAAVRRVRSLHEQAGQQQAVIAERRSRVEEADIDHRRNRDLAERRTISEQQLQHSRTALETARAQLAQAEHQLEMLRIEIGDTDIPHHPEVTQAIAGLRSAWLGLERTRLVAPITGFVANRQVQIGQYVVPGTPLMAVVPLDQLWVEANFKETELDRLRIGQPARVVADFYGNRVTYHGTVEGISAGTGSTFELLPPQNATGNWIKVVQRVPVRIALSPEDLAEHPLRLGLSLTATIDISDHSGPALASEAARGARYQTDVYHHQEAGLDEVIRAIIARNGGDKSTTEAATADPGQDEGP